MYYKDALPVVPFFRYVPVFSYLPPIYGFYKICIPHPYYEKIVNISKSFHLGGINVQTTNGKQHNIYRKNILSRPYDVTIQDGVQDGRHTMTNSSIFQNPYILGGLNVLTAYVK